MSSGWPPKHQQYFFQIFEEGPIYFFLGLPEPSLQNPLLTSVNTDLPPQHRGKAGVAREKQQWLSFGLGVVIFSACAQTPQSAYHPRVPGPPLAGPKTMLVISDPTEARIAVNQEYLGEVIKFPAEQENGKYAFERTILGAGAAIVRAITGQRSSEPPDRPAPSKRSRDRDGS
jgi:hypothetical protein